MEIYVNGKALELAPNASVSMVFNNTLFDNDVLQGSFSYPFTLPATPRNRLILGFPEVVENLANLDSEFDCIFRYEVLAIEAKLKIREVKPGSYTVNLFTQVGAVADKLKSVKLNQLDLERVPLPMETRPCVTLSFYTTDDVGPAVGTVIVFKVFRQNGTEVWHPVVWRGSTTLLVADLAERINSNTPVLDYNPATTYNQFSLAKDASGNIWECQYDNVTGHPPADPLFDSAALYPAGFIVNDGSDNFFKALVNNASGPLTNTAVWQSVPNPYWWLISMAADWPNQWRAAITPNWYLYDDPFDDYTIDAVVATTQLYLFDASGGGSPLDYMLIWQQSWGTLHVADGLQSVDSTSFESNFRLVIDAMFTRSLAGPWPASNFTFPTIYNPGAFDDSVFDPTRTTAPYINYYLGGEYKYSISGAKDFFSPQVFLGHVLTQLFAELGVNFSLQAFESVEQFKRLLVYNNTACVKLVRDPLGSYLVLPFEIKLQDHVPAIALGEFLNSLRSFLFWGFVFDMEARSCRLVNLRDVLAAGFTKDWTMKAEATYKLVRDDPQGFKLAYTLDNGDELTKQHFPDLSKYTIGDPVATLAELPATVTDLKQVRYVQEKDAYYRPLWATITTVAWEEYAWGLQPLVVGEGKTARTPKAAPLFFARQEDHFAYTDYSTSGRQVLVPTTTQKLSVFDLGIESPASLRLLYWWGMQKDSLGQDYPLGSAGIEAWDGTQLGTVALRYDGPNGIYEQLGKDWLAFLQSTKKVTRSARLTSLDVKQLQQDDKIRIDGSDFLWRSCKVAFPIVKPAEVELWHVTGTAPF